MRKQDGIERGKSCRDERGERTEPTERPGCDYDDERRREANGDDPGPKEDVIRRANISIQELTAEREFIGIGSGLRVRMEFEAIPRSGNAAASFDSGGCSGFNLQSPVVQ